MLKFKSSLEFGERVRRKYSRLESANEEIGKILLEDYIPLLIKGMVISIVLLTIGLPFRKYFYNDFN